MRSFYKMLLLIFFGMGLAGNAFAQKSDSTYYRPASRILFQSDFEDASLDPLHARSGRAALRVQNKSVQIARLAVKSNEKVYVQAWVQFENQLTTRMPFSGLPLATPLYGNPASVEAIPFVPANPFVWVEAGRQLREALAPKPQASLEVKFFTQKQDLLYTQTQAIRPGKGWQEVVVANQMPQNGTIEVSLLNPGSRMLWADDVVVSLKEKEKGSGLDTLRATNGCHCSCGFVEPGSCACNPCGGTEPDLPPVEPTDPSPGLPPFFPTIPGSGMPSPTDPPGGGVDMPPGGDLPGGTGGGNQPLTSEQQIDLILTQANFDGWLERIRQAAQSGIANGITTSAEVAHEIYTRLAAVTDNNPQLIAYANRLLAPFKAGVDAITDKDPTTMSWFDLTNIWLFELGNSGNLGFNQGDITTNNLLQQEGVQKARQLALQLAADKKKAGNKEDGSVEKRWDYNQAAFYQGVTEANVTTSFLGSYLTQVNVKINGDGTATFTYTVRNRTGWASGSRLRKDNDGDGQHDAIIPDKSRGSGIELGGTIDEVWTWRETVIIPD
jgi:hypothetical protein